MGKKNVVEIHEFRLDKINPISKIVMIGSISAAKSTLVRKEPDVIGCPRPEPNVVTNGLLAAPLSPVEASKTVIGR